MTQAVQKTKELRCVSLNPSQIAQVFPLIRETVPEFGLAEWRRHAAKLIAKEDGTRRGILTVRNDAGYFYGLAVYHVVPTEAGAMLVADHFIAFDVPGRTEVSDVLLAGLDALARRLVCVAVETSLARPRGRTLPRRRP
jgi:hypothetical protein